ncbi:glycoside hydrolase family 9 protein [Bacillus sp. FSL M8-0266]|uniref:Endoglucanase n=1 Tax=Bacillus pumilus TaxID=1408 RepID=A0AB34QQ25_BACPU|nr:glycoside hydrolase family 9 protein [Bacillus pumilus]KIL12357.1 Endoglucanase 4 precursor [Bacillus pumilus]MBB6601665.1 glycoside hydrolase family 9 protein [Bacillus pumilus]MCY7575305.1 glycoside hydrolase family 9 protein [Bacillus pumilus]RAP16917.1 Endoglucanase 4 precursor [Bacillus pumilus]RAU07072.1 endoglucanase [Bacillus pumilus]
MASYNYVEVLQKSLLFYEAQRSGKLPKSNRLNWRGDSGLEDGKDVGHDLTGGWYDAGDHVKFGLPMAYSAAVLAWTVYEYREAYEEAELLDDILDQIRWATDYFLKAHTGPNEFWAQVGDGNADHAWWGPAEVMPMSRPAFKIDENCPGTEVAAQTAAALAAGSIIFKETDAPYAAKLLTHAKQLYAFADRYRGEYTDCVTNAQPFYNSWSGYIDELIWGGIWLYLATNEETYLNQALKAVEEWPKDWDYTFTMSWDNTFFASQILLARITKENRFIESTERNLDYWTTGFVQNGKVERITYTPGGLAWLDQWGSLRYTANAAFLAFVYADWVSDKEKKNRYQTFAINQTHYMLGDNPLNRSYVVGFGQNPPKHPHHRTAHGSWSNQLTNPSNHRHTLYGALVGGPNAQDQYDDDISDYVSNEVATDYNAAFTGNIAKMVQLFGKGQSKLPNFPPKEQPEDEFFVEAAVMNNDVTSTQVKAVLYNRSGWPARRSQTLSFRYYVNLSEVFAKGFTEKDIQVTAAYNEGASLSPLKVYDASAHVYYAEIDFTGVAIFPGGESEHKKEIQFRLSAPNGSNIWDASNDYSFQGLTSNMQKTTRIPVFDDGALVFGTLPDK